MTTPSDERRLHPASPVFALVESLKRFLLPLVILLFTGRGDRNEWISAILVSLLALQSVVRYFTFRYRIDADGVVIRSGLVFRSVRHVPFDRIQNVTLQQSMLHRVFGVADVELESAGGRKAEGSMRVLSLDDAHAIEATVREHGRAVRRDEPAVAAPAIVTPLLTLDVPELVRLGVASNRALVLIAAAIGGLMQFGSEEFSEGVVRVFTAASSWTSSLHVSAAVTVLAGIAAALVVLVVLGALSTALAIMRYFEFVLTDDGRRLRIERGLFTRVRGALQRRRIQAFTIRESLVHRALRRRSLRVDAVGATADDQRSLRELAPIASAPVVDALVSHLLGVRAAWPPERWLPLHPAAWRRELVRPVIWSVLLAGAGYVWLGPWGLLVLAGIPLGVVRARLWARHAAYAVESGLVAVREGWFSRTWRFAEVGKLQVLSVEQTPFDRRHGMATLALDTAGADNRGLSLRIRYLPEADARTLHRRLAATITG